MTRDMIKSNNHSGGGLEVVKTKFSALIRFLGFGKKRNIIQVRGNLVTCIVCGKLFNQSREHLRCCSPECKHARVNWHAREYQRLDNPPQERRCKECGTPFILSKAHKKYCSLACLRLWTTRRGCELRDSDEWREQHRLQERARRLKVHKESYWDV